jgi:hypothetical protein
MKQQDQDTANRIFQTILTAIPKLKVCNASASPSGKSIQARVTWPENGKVVIGYVTYEVQPTLSKTTQRDLIDSIFRVEHRAYVEVEAYNIPSHTKYGNGESKYERTKAISDELDRLIGAQAYPSLDLICDEVDRKMDEVLKSGVQFANNRKHIKKQATIKLKKTLDEILTAGITDEEIHEMLQEAIVKYIQVM